ncbi:SAV_6107 family HEPN domain-containing protein [Microlunatus speluncae]|uniref:SAV_6107 family HEPN domain-containing protein n=1 Tax=Microlunatus speluncae TaxID=2594267 RepID=UPI00126635B4|nr:SAV_6107 family HEPN domain-containing protein [Microlunatus speluncae]
MPHSVALVSNSVTNSSATRPSSPVTRAGSDPTARQQHPGGPSHPRRQPALPTSFPRPDHDRLPAALRADLQRIESTLLEAELADRPSDRYLAAHLAALRIGALIVRLRSAQVRFPSHLWSLVTAVAPEFGEWAAFFAATEAKRETVRSGATSIVTEREAADLLRDAGLFYQQLHTRLAAQTGRRPGRPGSARGSA